MKTNILLCEGVLLNGLFFTSNPIRDNIN